MKHATVGAAAPIWRPTERQFQAAVITLAGWCGWRTYHTHDSRHSPAGFPDLCMVRGNRLVVAELKVGQRQLTMMLQIWLDELAAVSGVESYCWHPADWEAIERVLARERKRRAQECIAV